VVRQYAFSHLAQTPADAETCDRHSRFYLALLEGREPILRSRAQVQALDDLLREVGNLRAAWDWAVRRGLFAPLAGAVRCFGCLFELEGWLEEGVSLLERSRAPPGGDGG
jgi:hypothetical protein